MDDKVPISSVQKRVTIRIQRGANVVAERKDIGELVGISQAVA